MKKIIVFVSFLVFVSPVFAQESSVHLENGKMIVQTEGETSVLDYDREQKYAPSSLNKWEVKRESSVIKEALDVYNRKSASLYSEKLSIINKEDGTQQVYVEYQSRDGNENIVFTDDENFGFYLGLSDEGTSMVYGINILDQQTKAITEADDFSMTTCPNTEMNYIVVEKDGSEDTFLIYNVNGNLQKEISYTGSIDDLNDVICY